MKEHEANREYWDRSRAERTERQTEESGIWRLCTQEPTLAFDCEALVVVRECVPCIVGKDICILGSGDNLSSFALASLGANVTSVDQSEKQLEVARRRAEVLGLPITFVQSDATNLQDLNDGHFDLVCSTNGFFIWIADLDALCREAHRVLKPNGHYVSYDIHPFQRPWKESLDSLRMEKPYFETQLPRNPETASYNFHWTMADLLNSLARSGLSLTRMCEAPAESRFWEGTGYLPGSRPELLDWKVNPLAGLPVWLIVAAQKLR